MGGSVLTQARELVSACRYLEALDVLQRRIDALVPEPMDEESLTAEAFVDDLEVYLERYDAGPATKLLEDALECVTLCAAATELCVLTLGLGTKAVELIKTAATTAECLPEPFNEMLKATPAYLRMMWYYDMIPDRGVALRNAFRVAAAFPDSLLEYRCKKILEAEDWDVQRCSNVNIYFIIPDENPEIITAHTLLGLPTCNEAYQAAVYDTTLASFERGRHTKQNDTSWMYSLFYMADSVYDLIKSLPVGPLGASERSELYDVLVKPLVDHIDYQRSDGFKNDYQSPAKVALKKLSGDPYTDLPSIRRLRAIESGEDAGETRLVARLPVDGSTGYAISTAFKDRRVFLSSSFADMLSERDYLLTYIFPDVDSRLRAYGMRLTPVDLRGIKLDGSEEWYDKECFRFCMSEIDRSDSMLGLVGSRYGWVMFDETSTDPAMQAVVAKTAREHGVPIAELQGKSITHIEMMYGLRTLKLDQCYFYLRELSYTGAGSWARLKQVGFADGQQYVPDGRQGMIVDAYGISQIAPEDEPGANVQYYSASFDGERISGVERLGENIRTKLLYDAISKRSFKKTEDAHARMLSFWSDMAHQTIPHPRLRELLDSKARFIMVTGEEGIGKTVLLAQFWEAMREQAPVVAMEALLDQRDDSLTAMLSRAEELAESLRRKLPKENRHTSDVYFIFDGLERTVERGMRIMLSDEFGDDYPRGYHFIMCLHEEAAFLPDKFKVIRLTKPPASAEDLVRNTVFRTGKRLDTETVERVATLARRSGTNPLYTDLLTRRLVYLLQDEFKRDPEGWFDEVTAALDGSVATAEYLMVDRAAKALENPMDRLLAKAVLDELMESRHGSLQLAALSVILQERDDAERLGATEGAEAWANRLLHVLVLLKPLLLFDSTMQTATLAHRSLIGSGTRAEAQEKLVEEHLTQQQELEHGEQMSFGYVAAAVVAVALAALQLAFPFATGPVIPTIIQTIAFALVLSPLALHRDAPQGETDALAMLLTQLLYWLGVAASGLTPILLLMPEDLPQPLADMAPTLVACYPAFVVALGALHCASRSAVALSEKERGAAAALICAIVTCAAALVGIFGMVWQAPAALPMRVVSLVLLALTYYLCRDADKKEQE